MGKRNQRTGQTSFEAGERNASGRLHVCGSAGGMPVYPRSSGKRNVRNASRGLSAGIYGFGQNLRCGKIPGRIFLCAGSDESVPDDGGLVPQERALAKLRAVCHPERKASARLCEAWVLSGRAFGCFNRKRFA